MNIDYVFQDAIPSDAGAVADGRLQVAPADPAQRGRRDLAMFVMEHGVEALVQGSGPIAHIVLPMAPTLDDMLAAELAKRLLQGQPLPDNVRNYARYAALVREGLQPGDVPLEQSIEGIYQAVLNEHGGDLRDPAAAQRFCQSWPRMAGRLMESAEQGKDPFTDPLFEDAEFARERAFLARDYEVYRQDVARGQQWKVRIPGGPPTAAGLVLVEPKSLLFKHWSRSDRRSPVGEAYLFLAVNWGQGQWVFSTDPVQRLSIKSLAERLQAAEQERTGDGPSRVWFDGAPFGHTLVAYPKNGTSLSDAEVLRVVKKWLRARSVSEKASIRRSAILWTAASAAVLLVALIAFKVADSSNDGRDGVALHGEAYNRKGLRYLHEGGRVKEAIHLYVLSIGVSRYAHSDLNLDLADDDARALADVFYEQQGKPFEKVTRRVLTDEDAVKGRVLQGLAWLKDNATQNDLVIVTASGHGLRDTDGEYFFVPHDFDPQQELLHAAVPWRDFVKYLKDLPCAALVIMDTCHSGAITRQGPAGTRGPLAQQELERSVGTAVRNFEQVAEGVVMIAGCMSGQSAYEDKKWGHGALTLAVIEGITSQRLYTASDSTPLPRDQDDDNILSLMELTYYVTKRVKEVAGGKQAVLENNTGNMPLDRIPICVFSDDGTADPLRLAKPSSP